MMGAADERAIKEDIADYCPKLQKDGIKKIGFLIVSNSFKSDISNYINEITWRTEIKRFSLITSEALLHLLGIPPSNHMLPSNIKAYSFAG
jgi:hypothetical protein